MRYILSPKRPSGRASLLCLLAITALFLCANPAGAVTLQKITAFAGHKNPDISFRNNTITFFGATITERQEGIKVFFHKKLVHKEEIGRISPELTTARDADVALDYPQPGMATLFVGIFTGGAACCTSTLVLTKGPDGLTMTNIYEGRGGEFSPKDIADGKPLSFSNPCIGQLDLQKVADDFFWPAAMVPRPTTFLVPENGTFRFARPGEFKTAYNELLAKGMAPYQKAPAGNTSQDDDLGVAYADAVDLLYDAVMAGKTDAECDAVLHTILPGLSKERRVLFLKALRLSMDSCEAISTTKLQ